MLAAIIDIPPRRPRSSGDNIGFAIGRHGGRKLFERPGPFHEHRLKVLDQGEPFFARIVWGCATGLAVYALGDVAEKIFSVAGPAAAGVFVLAVIAFLVWRHRRSRGEQYGAAP